MPRASRSVRPFAVALAAALALAATAGDAARGVPAGFQPLDAALKLDGRPSDFMLPDTIDLSWGVSMISCPSGAWRGKVRFVGHAGGDIDYDGDMYGCFTFGKGTARYADGTSYTGSVNAYVAAGLDNFTRLTAEGVRMAVPEGVGTALQLGVAAREQAFVRGAASVDPRDPRFSQLDAALVGLGRDAVAAGVWLVQNGGDAGALVEKGVAKVEGHAASAERAAIVAAGQAERLGTQVVTQGLAVSKDAEAFARRAAGEAQGAGVVVDKLGRAVGDVPGMVQKHSNSTTGANAVAKLDTPKNDIGSKLFGGSSKPAATPSPAKCLAGRWQRPSCGGSTTVELGFSGGERGTGHRIEGACPATCPQGGRSEFNYAFAGDGTLRLEFTGGATCGRSIPAPPEQHALACAGDALRLGEDYRRVGR